MEEEIIRFIDRFTRQGQLKDTITTFTDGCCFWFAFILHTRFPDSTIMYDPVIGHFITRIHGHDYDIRGDVTGKYEAYSWDDGTEQFEKAHVIRDCVNF